MKTLIPLLVAITGLAASIQAQVSSGRRWAEKGIYLGNSVPYSPPRQPAQIYRGNPDPIGAGLQLVVIGRIDYLTANGALAQITWANGVECNGRHVLITNYKGAVDDVLRNVVLNPTGDTKDGHRCYTVGSIVEEPRAELTGGVVRDTSNNAVKSAYAIAGKYLKPYISIARSALLAARSQKAIPPGMEAFVEERGGYFMLKDTFVQDVSEVSRYSEDEKLVAEITDLLMENARRCNAA